MTLPVLHLTPAKRERGFVLAIPDDDGCWLELRCWVRLGWPPVGVTAKVQPERPPWVELIIRGREAVRAAKARRGFSVTTATNTTVTGQFRFVG